MVSHPARSILLCSTPRSGSTLLCSLLASSGVAGRPESWFRREDRAEYATGWGVPERDFPAFLQSAIRAGQSPNATFACRVMADTREELLTDLRTLFPHGSDSAILTHAFGRIDYVFLTRDDTVAQAVSRHIAEAGGLWHRHPEGSVLEARPGINGSAPDYDFAAIDAYRREAEAAAQDWHNWFAQQAIDPINVTYEALAADPTGTTYRLLTQLGLTAVAPIRAGTSRLAGKHNIDWAARYRAERSERRQ